MKFTQYDRDSSQIFIEVEPILCKTLIESFTDLEQEVKERMIDEVDDLDWWCPNVDIIKIQGDEISGN